LAAEKFRSYFEAVEAEIIIDDKMLLNNYGFAGEVIHTPGHSEGSLSVIVDKDCFCGDTFFNVFKSTFYPPFADDQEKLLKSWEKIFEYGCERYYPGHGKSFSHQELLKTMDIGEDEYE